MALSEDALRKGFRNGWLFTVMAAALIVGSFFFVWLTNTPAQPERWDVGGTPFVPASSSQAEGYYLPPTPGYGGPSRVEP